MQCREMESDFIDVDQTRTEAAREAVTECGFVDLDQSWRKAGGKERAVQTQDQTLIPCLHRLFSIRS